MSTATKRISLRITPQQLDEVHAAAHLAGTSTNEFCRRLLVGGARNDAEVAAMSARMDALESALAEALDERNEAQRDALDAHGEAMKHEMDSMRAELRADWKKVMQWIQQHPAGGAPVAPEQPQATDE